MNVLSITGLINIRHGGNVTCNNRPSGGASFVLRLPVTGGNRLENTC